MSENVCPDPEALAALAEHEASTPQREGLIRHIAECHDCYVAFVGTVRLLDAVASSGQPAAHNVSRPVLGARGRPGRTAPARPGYWLLPAAAAALLATGMGIAWLQVSHRQAEPTAAQKAPSSARPDPTLGGQKPLS